MVDLFSTRTKFSSSKNLTGPGHEMLHFDGYEAMAGTGISNVGPMIGMKDCLNAGQFDWCFKNSKAKNPSPRYPIILSKPTLIEMRSKNVFSKGLRSFENSALLHPKTACTDTKVKSSLTRRDLKDKFVFSMYSAITYAQGKLLTMIQDDDFVVSDLLPPPPPPPLPVDPPPSETIFDIDGDVMVDFNSYYRHGPGGSRMGQLSVNKSSTEGLRSSGSSSETLARIYRRKYDNATGRSNEKWEDDQKMLCPPRVLGYVLKEKQWAQLDVYKLVSIPPTDKQNAFNKIHLNDGDTTKELIYGLVKNHGLGDPQSSEGYQITDIVPEKGQGLVILLYGNPGVGKTSTGTVTSFKSRNSIDIQ
jgi:hypothetical protein